MAAMVSVTLSTHSRMTDEERERDRACKEDVTAWLSTNAAKMMRQHADVMSTDDRLTQYVLGVTENPDKHNLYEQLSVKRFFELCGRYEFSQKRVRKFFKFYEILKFSGTAGRRRYKLTPIQAFQYANIYGFVDHLGRRLCRTAYIFVPRKFSKTTSTAAVAVYDMLFGDNNAQGYIGANSYDQAKICFDEIRAIMRGIDPSERHFRINREKIMFKDKGHDSFIKCVTSNARTQDGLFASLVVMDEYAQARNTKGKNGADLRNVLTSSMGPRTEPLTVIITTASDVLDGPFIAELEGVKTVLRGEQDNDMIFASLFMPDADDEEGDPNTWAKVQPHLGITVQPDFYEKEYATAKLSADNMLAFRTKLLNIFTVNEQQAWISAAIARNVSRPLDITQIKGRPDAMVAVDLSESDDFSAVSFGMYDVKNKSFFFHTAYFFPEGALPGHPNEKLYRKWAADGRLFLTTGTVINYSTIVEYILELNKYVRILAIGYDQWKSQEMINMLAAAGASKVLAAVPQTYGHFTAPVESMEHGIKTGRIHINDNPINAYCFGNAIMDVDHMENKKPIKKTANQKIDGVITMLMCMYWFIHYKR